MLNMIKMDLYRMFHTKAVYVIWIVMAASICFTTSLSKVDYQALMQDTNGVQENPSEEEALNLGMQVTIPTEPGEKVTVYDQVYGNLQGKFVALFLLIYVVIFSAADLSSGYIKNIGGQVRKRHNLILSKAAVLFLFTALSLLLYVILQAVSQGLFFGYLEWGSLPALVKYMAVQLFLHYALVLICMALSVIRKNNVISMTLSVCLSMNVMTILYSGADKILQRMGIDDFHLIEHTVTGKITLLPMYPGTRELMYAFGTATGFLVAAAVLTCLVFRRRDI